MASPFFYWLVHGLATQIFLWSVVGIILVNAATYSPNGKKDGIQVIPLSEVAAKDEFLNIKNVSCDNMLVVNLMPP